MELIRICQTCKKGLEIHEWNSIPVFMGASPDFPLPSGGAVTYCEKCYNDAIGKSYLDDQKKLKDIKKIEAPSDLENIDEIQLVDELSRISDEEKSIKERKEKLKEKIVNLFLKNGKPVIKGTGKKASISSYNKIEYPKTDDFFELLKKKGIWEQVISINSTKFKSQIKHNKIDTEILDLMTIEKAWQIRLSSL